MEYYSNSNRWSKTFREVVLTICIFNLVFGASLYAEKRITKEPRPEWIDRISTGIYVGVSHRFPDEADARADALADAKRQIIETLGGVIESEFIDEIVERSGEINTDDAFTSSRIKVVSRNIISVKPSKVFVEKWKIREGFKSRTEYQVFVAVPFSEENHRKFMKELVDETIRLGEDRYNESLKLAQQGLILLALDQMQTIQANIAPLLKLTGLLPREVALLNRFNEEVAAKIETIPGSIRIEGWGGNQSAKMGLPVAEPLEIAVFWIDGDQKFPIPDLSVNFSVAEGKATLSAQNKTDRNGKATCAVKNIASAGRIEIQADILFPENLKIADSRYSFILLPDNKIMVKIIETNLGRPVDISYLENALLERLTAAGFQIIENSPFRQLTENQLQAEQAETIIEMVKNNGTDLVILGAISSGQTSKIRDGFYFARARGTLKIYNIQCKSVVGSYMIENKNAGYSAVNAGFEAIKKVSNKLIDQILTEMGLE
jgi:hypothetical protein